MDEPEKTVQLQSKNNAEQEPMEPRHAPGAVPQTGNRALEGNRLQIVADFTVQPPEADRPGRGIGAACRSLLIPGAHFGAAGWAGAAEVLGFAAGRFDLRSRRLREGIRDVLGNGTVKQVGNLVDQYDFSAQILEPDLAKV